MPTCQPSVVLLFPINKIELKQITSQFFHNYFLHIKYLIDDYYC